MLLTLALSITLLIIFYGKLLIHPCHTYFGSKGDGMQIYYQTLYHIRFDMEWWRQKSINYPYGESIFFTGAMPFVNNFVKLFGPAAGPWGVGLINLMMLFSPVIGAVFIYAIFKHLKLPWHYSAVCAGAIAFLSPQLARFNGHYSLAWVFLIPAILFLLLRFYDYPSVKKSFAIAFLVFLGATTHLYFLAFFLAIGIFFWGTLFFTIDRGFGRIGYVAKHASIQFFLPVAILQALILFSDHVKDRTLFPWGFLVFHSNNTGVFFPFNRPYEHFFGMFWKHADVGYEGVAYVGLAAIIGLIAIFGIQCYRLLKLRFRLIFSVTDNKVLNIYFWTAVILMWISFAWPFLNGNEEWLLKAGPLKQFRAIGRFAWVFFYVANIVVVYRLYKVSLGKKIISIAVLFIIPSILLFDMYYNARRWQDSLNNKIVELEDENNLLPQDAWAKNFNSSLYQAILPLPYFHVGSENLMRDPHDKEIINCTYIVSLKTGLPMMSVLSARTSLSQTNKMLPLILDPLRPIPVLKDLPDNRPLLLVVRADSLDENEKRILSISKPVATSDKYNLFSVLPSEIAALAIHQYDSVKVAFQNSKKFTNGNFIVTDSAAEVVHCDYDTMKGPAYRGRGGYTGSIRDYNALYDGAISKPGEYIGSFWANNADKDVYPRSSIEVYANDPNNKDAPSYYLFTDKFSPIKAIEGSWVLIEFPITIPCANAHLKITCWNYSMRKQDNFEADELLIRPAGTDVYNVKGDTIYRNNRTYFPQK